MNFYVGVTDNQWYKFLAARNPDEVNFWRPGGGTFRAIDPGSPFLFKLHSPLNYIAGGGFFVRYAQLPLSLAWDTFEEKNGAADYLTFYEQIERYRSPRGSMHPNPEIGCIVLVQPFFFPEEDWIPVPKEWHPNIVQGKTYDTAEETGARLWAQVQERLAAYAWLSSAIDKEEEPSILAEERARYGAEYPVAPRLGQGAFRVVVTEAYGRRCAVRCAVIGERTLPVLQAAHIKPYSESGPHQVDNGLLLRADLHILLDRGYLTLTEDLHVEVSRRIKKDFHNGEHYYSLHGRPLANVPRRTIERPSPEFVRWHNEHQFLGYRRRARWQIVVRWAQYRSRATLGMTSWGEGGGFVAARDVRLGGGARSRRR
jgi:putative restriction endonuclease